MNIGYVGSTKVSKSILERCDFEPEVVISFDENLETKISGYAEYQEYADKWVQVESINSQRSASILKKAELDMILVMGWQELLNKNILDIP